MPWAASPAIRPCYWRRIYSSRRACWRGELSQRAQAYRRLVLEKQEAILQGFSFSMAPAMTFTEIGSAISEHFPAMGIERWYVMYYSDVTSPQSISSAPPESYNLLLQYEASRFEIPRTQTIIG